MHGSEVDDSFAVGPRTGNPLGSHFADKEAVTGTSDIFFPWRCILDGSGFVADTTFDYMLMHLAFHIDERMADSAGDHGGAPTIRAGQR